MIRSWLPSYSQAQGNRDGCLRLFCLPHAGAGASLYRAWGEMLPASVAVCPVQLPAREERYSEPPPASIVEIARELASVIAATDGAYALFGYSMGALIAFEVARQARRRGFRMPEGIVVAAHQAPQIPILRRPIWNLPETQFLEELREMGGMSEEVFDYPELLEFLLPVLRSDFRICDHYQHLEEVPLNVPLVAIGGSHDSHVPRPLLDAWSRQTVQRFRSETIPGGHFFLKESRDLLMKSLKESLREFSSPCGDGHRNHAGQGL